MISLIRFLYPSLFCAPQSYYAKLSQGQLGLCHVRCVVD